MSFGCDVTARDTNSRLQPATNHGMQRSGGDDVSREINAHSRRPLIPTVPRQEFRTTQNKAAMTDESQEHEVSARGPDRGVIYQSWSSGWMMGIGFGVLVMFVATELPNSFFDRARFMLLAAGVVTFVFGFIRLRYSGLLDSLFNRQE
jgi:hypothetical protein